MLTRDVEILDTHPNTLMLDKHVEYLATYSRNKDGYEQTMVEYLRMSGIYWGMTAMELMDRLAEIGRLMGSRWECNCVCLGRQAVKKRYCRSSPLVSTRAAASVPASDTIRTSCTR